MAAALKEKAPTDPVELKKWREEEQAKERAKRDREKTEIGSLWSRRDFLGVLGWAGFGAFSLLGLLAAVRSAFPRVLFLPPSKFKAGLPDDYVVGEVSEKYKQDFRTWIIRTKAGFYAIFAKCTHLGCTPRWLKTEEKFKCPCHGSGYYISGLNFEGPAPRPMDRFKIYVGDDGQLVVDKAVVYTMEPGADPNEQHPEQVIKTVLACTMAGGPNAKMAAPEVIAMLMSGSKLMPTDPEKGFDIMMPALMPAEFIAAHPEIKQLMVAGAKMMPPTPAETADRAMAGIASFNAYDRLGEIKCPVMIVHGAQDVLVPTANAELIKSKIPQAEMYIIAGAGHAFQAVDPVGIHQKIAGWLRN